jgi:hypothetical protein
MTVYAVAIGEPNFGIAAPFAVGLSLLVAVQAGGKFTGKKPGQAGLQIMYNAGSSVCSAVREPISVHLGVPFFRATYNTSRYT